ncbi:MT-A70 family methyltransferase [Aeromonas veronii]
MKIDISSTSRKYRVIYADPAWQFKSKKSGGSMKSGAAQVYTVTAIEDMKALPVAKLAEDNCMLVMWWVGSMPQEAIDLCKAWGFRVMTMTGFVWEKRTVNDNPHFGMGWATRAGAECALIGIKGKVSKLVVDKTVRSVIRAKVGCHSEKPHEFREAIEKLCGDVPRIELFARSYHQGWDCWGNEVPSTPEQSAA